MSVAFVKGGDNGVDFSGGTANFELQRVVFTGTHIGSTLAFY